MTLYDINALCVFYPISYYSQDQETLISTLDSKLKNKKKEITINPNRHILEAHKYDLRIVPLLF